MFKNKKKRFVALEINEYVVRAIAWNGGNIENVEVKEKLLPKGIVEGDIIKDEMAFYEFMKETVKEWGIKRYDARFFAPDSAVMMKTFEHAEELDSSQLKGYVEMELGRTIHLPFSHPLIDVYDDKPNDGVATLFAAPSEEVNKLSGLLNDVTLHPVVADVRSLSTIRLLEHLDSFEAGKSYLIVDWSLNGVSISIYTTGKLEFLRYQPIEIDISRWDLKQMPDDIDMHFAGNIEEYRALLMDQLAEIDRILNFYRFSLHKGEKAVDEIIVLGDSPELSYIKQELSASYTTLVRDGNFRNTSFKNKHLSLIGLVLKEGL